MKGRPLVYIQLPRTGLGNMLYVWAYGLVLAKHLGVEPVVSSWSRLHPGALLRRERSGRLYWNQLRSSPWPRRLVAWWQCRRSQPYAERPDAASAASAEGGGRFRVAAMGPTPVGDSFRDLKGHRAFLLAALQRMIGPKVRAELSSAPAPCVGIHVRRGDFRGSDWLTPIEYFCERLRSVREVVGETLPAVIFSDGSDDELTPLLRMANVVRAPVRSDVADLLVLSQSRLLIASGVSTFSNWASFLSEGIIIRNPRWLHQEIRPSEVNEATYEGTPAMEPAQWPVLLVRNIQSLGSAVAVSAR